VIRLESETPRVRYRGRVAERDSGKKAIESDQDREQHKRSRGEKEGSQPDPWRVFVPVIRGTTSP
jgi:hypothetical protein